MKEKFEKPIITVIEIGSNDIIATSGCAVGDENLTDLLPLGN